MSIKIDWSSNMGLISPIYFTCDNDPTGDVHMLMGTGYIGYQQHAVLSQRDFASLFPAFMIMDKPYSDHFVHKNLVRNTSVKLTDFGGQIAVVTYELKFLQDIRFPRNNDGTISNGKLFRYVMMKIIMPRGCVLYRVVPLEIFDDRDVAFETFSLMPAHTAWVMSSLYPNDWKNYDHCDADFKLSKLFPEKLIPDL